MDQQREWQEQWGAINRMGQEWYNTPAGGNEAYRHALWSRIFIALDRKYKSDVQKEAIMDIMCNEWKDFDPAKGNVAQFISQRLKWRMIDIENRNVTKAPGYIWDGETQKWIKKPIPVSPIDAPSGDGKQDPTTIVDPAPPLIDNWPEETFHILLSAILDLPERLKGRANNPTRLNYFRLFFSDGTSWCIEQQYNPLLFQRHERDFFRVAKTQFLDFFLQRPCQTVNEIAVCHRRPYGEIVQGGDMKELKSPLPNDVYTEYLSKIEHYTAGNSAVSQQRTAYIKFLKNVLGYSIC